MTLEQLIGLAFLNLIVFTCGVYAGKNTKKVYNYTIDKANFQINGNPNIIKKT